MGTRKANGESSVFQGADGRWHGWVSVGQTGSSADRRHVTGRTRQEVVNKVRDLQRKRDAGTLPQGPALTVADWLEHWLDNIAARRVRPRTLESYRSLVRLHLVPGIGRHRLDRLQPEHLERLYTALIDDGLSSATVLRAHRVLSRALKVAMQRGRVTRNVAALVDPPSLRRTDIAQPLTVDEARRVLTTAHSRRNSARWTVALALGLRQSEALALRWTDIDLEAGKLTVRRGLHRVAGGGLVFEEPKNERTRTLALPLPLVAALHAHRAVQLEERYLAANLWQDNGLVFAQPNGRPLDKKMDWRDWKNLLKEAGVRDVRLHDGRHTAATLLLSEGVHPRVVMDLLGHTQMRTTTDIYSHVMPALAQEAADRMSALLLDNGTVTATTIATKPHEVDLGSGSRPLNKGGGGGTLLENKRTAENQAFHPCFASSDRSPARTQRAKATRARSRCQAHRRLPSRRTQHDPHDQIQPRQGHSPKDPRRPRCLSAQPTTDARAM